MGPVHRRERRSPNGLREAAASSAERSGLGLGVNNAVVRPETGRKIYTEPGRLTVLWREIKKHKASYLFLSPFLLSFAIFTVLPLLTALYLSFTYFNVLQPPEWIGLTNYRLLFLDDDIFILAIKNTIYFAIIAGPVSFFASFTLAWLINQLKRTRNTFSLAFFAPSLTSGIAMSVVWLVFLSGDRMGYLNYVLLELGILSEPYLWLENAKTILPSIIFVHLWMSLGAQFLAFLAGLQNVDPQLYEAGAIDGIKTRLQEVWFITLPSMKPQLLFGSVMAVVNSFNVFEIALALAGLPSPQYAGHTIVSHLVDYAFIRLEMGYASAIAVLLFIMTFGLSRVLFKMLRSDD